MVNLFSGPASYRMNNMGQLPLDGLSPPSPFVLFKKKPHDSHPSVGNLTLLVFEAVMEVVCVSLPGYIIARLGHFDAEKQKFLANLNVMLFTPCLIFTKLASQLNADKLAELGIIPIIFVIQTLVSYLVSLGVTKCFGFSKRASNFVIAMGVFGNSNSLPISLVLSLSQTIKGLHWDRIPGDNDDEVAARGILYLLVFQQLGQLVRWSWGYHVLLAPKDKYDEYNDEAAEEGRRIANDDDSDVMSEAPLLQRGSVESIEGIDPRRRRGAGAGDGDDSDDLRSDSEFYEPAGPTPVAGSSHASPAESDDEDNGYLQPTAHPHKSLSSRSSRDLKRAAAKHGRNGATTTPSHTNGHINGVNDTLAITSQQYDSLPDPGEHNILSFPRIHNSDEPEIPPGFAGLRMRISMWRQEVAASISAFLAAQFARLPEPFQRFLSVTARFAARATAFLWDFMNPPLWAMLLAILVASIPSLQRLFFREGSFIRNSVTSAVSSTGGVAVPLILVVLGANLARNTQNASPDHVDAEEKKIGTRLLVASLLCRMLLPTLVMAPILAVFAKYVPISILDDPIFVIVCFLLTGAPSALQLAQICQINNVFEGVMGRILFQSYVIWILPSTLVLVMAALEVVEAAK